MPEKNKGNFLSKFLFDLVMIVLSLFKVIPNLIVLIEFEAALARKNLISLIVLFIFAVSLLTSLWLCLFAMCFIYFISLHMSYLTSIFITFLVNFVLLLIILLMISRIQNHLTFPKTRQLLRTINK